jgi:hypothetical protein
MRLLEAGNLAVASRLVLFIFIPPHHFNDSEQKLL